MVATQRCPSQPDSGEIALENGVEIVGGFVAARQTQVQLLQPAPADGALDRLDTPAFLEQQPHGFAVEGILGLKFADRRWVG